MAIKSLHFSFSFFLFKPTLFIWLDSLHSVIRQLQCRKCTIHFQIFVRMQFYLASTYLARCKVRNRWSSITDVVRKCANFKPLSLPLSSWSLCTKSPFEVFPPCLRRRCLWPVPSRWFSNMYLVVGICASISWKLCKAHLAALKKYSEKMRSLMACLMVYMWEHFSSMKLL